MDAAEQWFVAWRCPKIRLMERGENPAAKGCYAAIGYKIQDVVTIGKYL